MGLCKYSLFEYLDTPGSGATAGLQVETLKPLARGVCLGSWVLWRPQAVPILGSHVPTTAKVSYISNIPQIML